MIVYFSFDLLVYFYSFVNNNEVVDKVKDGDLYENMNVYLITYNNFLVSVNSLPELIEQCGLSF